MPVVGTVYLNGCNYQVGYDLVSQSVANNTSTVNFWGKLNVTNNYVAWSRGTASTWNASAGLLTRYNKGSYIVVSKQVTLTHNNSGNYSATLSGSLSTTFVSGTASGNFTLPAIARLATVTSAPNFNDETYSVSVAFNNPANFNVRPYMNFYVNGTMVKKLERATAKYTSPYTWTITTAEMNELRALIPNATSCQVNIGFDTFNGSTNLGYNSVGRTFTITNANPTFNAAYLDTNSTTTAITQNNQKIIQNKSTLQINTTSLSAKKSATLSSIKAEINGTTYTATISGSSATFNIGTLNISSNTTAKLTLTDSRGLTATKNLTIQMLQWSTPTALITTERENNFYDPTTINVDANYSSLDNKNTIEIKMRYKKTTDSSYGSYQTLQDNTPVVVQLDNNYDWNVQVVVTDRLGSKTYNVIVNKGMPIIFFDKDKRSVAINGFPFTDEILQINGGLYTADDDGSNTFNIGQKCQLQECDGNGSSTSGTYFHLCHMSLASHKQGRFAYFKIFIGNGNNGRTNQNAYIELTLQQGWTGTYNGRFGGNWELHALETPFTLDNTNIIVTSNSNTEYDVWFYTNKAFCKPSYTYEVDKGITIIHKGENQTSQPSGSDADCLLSGKFINSPNIETTDNWNIYKFGNFVICSKRINTNINGVTSQWGGIYSKDNAIPAATYPVTFKNPPAVTITPITAIDYFSSAGQWWPFNSVDTAGTTTKSPAFGVARGAAIAATFTISYIITAIGEI